jgi:hypothetical protein
MSARRKKSMIEILTLRDVARKSGAGFRTVQRHVQQGKLKTSKLGKLLNVVTPQEFERWFAANVAGGGGR